MNIFHTSPMVISDPLAAFGKKGMFKVIAPAKTNLALAVGELRPDGYHQTTTIMHTLSLHDIIHVDHYPEDISGLEIEVACLMREGLESVETLSENNLASRAIYLLAEKIERTVHEKFVIRIEKHIPLEAGLGGGSSNAAAALMVAAHVWNIDILSDAVLSTAAELGSDVSFFLYGGCAYLTGTGEKFQRALAPMKKILALIKPSNGMSTKLAYQAFDENPFPVPNDIFARISSVRLAEEVPLFNNLSKAAETLLPELAKIRIWAEKQPGVEGVLLSGSGSATIVMCNSFAHAHHIVTVAKTCGWWARVTSFSSLGATLVSTP